MKLEKQFWSLIFLALVAVSGWNIYQGNRLKKELAGVPNSGSQTAGYLEARAYELDQSGKFIERPQNMKALGEPSEEIDGYGLVLAISDLSCDVCRDEQTQFVETLASRCELPILRVVVGANHIMYARSYTRLSGMVGPVYFDEDSEFFKANQLGSSPLLLLHNPNGEVIATHYPIPGKPEWSKPFHEMIQEFFEQLL